MNNSFSTVTLNYVEMNARFDECVRQTDKILAEQGARFEAKLDAIQDAIRRSQNSQTAAIASLGNRLTVLEGLTETSRETLESKIATVAETMGRNFVGLSTMIKHSKLFCLQFLNVIEPNATRFTGNQDPFFFGSGMHAFNASLGGMIGLDKPLIAFSKVPLRYHKRSNLHREHGVRVPVWSITWVEGGTFLRRMVPDQFRG
jgi:hypothetical protein